MSQLLNGRVVLVTGAGQGLGRDIALSLASEGASVVVNDIGTSLGGEGSDATPAKSVADEIEAVGGKAISNFDSVTDFDAAHSMVEQAIETFGRLDGIVNNAGILRDVIFHKMTEEDFDKVIAVHLKGTFNVSRAAATRFRDQEFGRMVHMTSTSGLIGTIGQANYAAAKMGIIGLSRTISMEMSRYNVTSNAIAPFAFSRMTGSIPVKNEEDKQRMDRIKKMEGTKVGSLVAALLSEEAADVTGQIFSVRANEIFLYNQIRPIRSLHRANGWLAQDIIDHVFPAFAGNFTPPARSNDVFCWDPV